MQRDDEQQEEAVRRRAQVVGVVDHQRRGMHVEEGRRPDEENRHEERPVEAAVGGEDFCRDGP